MDEDAERPAAGVGDQRVAAAIRFEAHDAPVLKARINPALRVERNRLRPFPLPAAIRSIALQQLVARIRSGGQRWRRLRLPCHRLDADRREQQISQHRANETEDRNKQDAHGGSV